MCNIFDIVNRIWALGKCAIEINYLLLLLFIIITPRYESPEAVIVILVLRSCGLGLPCTWC